MFTLIESRNKRNQTFFNVSVRRYRQFELKCTWAQEISQTDIFCLIFCSKSIDHCIYSIFLQYQNFNFKECVAMTSLKQQKQKPKNIDFLFSLLLNLAL